MSHVYVIQAVDGGPVKVGTALDPKQRLAQLQTAHHSELKIVLDFEATSRLEQRLHGYLSDFRCRGEWYEDCPDVWLKIRGFECAVKLERLIDAAVKECVQEIGTGLSRDVISERMQRFGDDVTDALVAVDADVRSLLVGQKVAA